MKIRRIIALLCALALWISGAQALASGLIGSVSGVSEGGDIAAPDQAQQIVQQQNPELYGLATEQPTEQSTGATISLGIGETTVAPQTTPDATGDSGYQLSAMEQALRQSLEGTVPVEGWHAHFVGDSTLVMVTMPEIIVWDIAPESGVMELKWYRQLDDILGEGASSPSVEVSPDGQYALVMPSDGSVYLLGADLTEQVAVPGTSPGRLIWAEDSLSYAYVVEGIINVRTLDGRQMTISGSVITPVADEYEWLNPAPTPEALEALLADQSLVLAGMNRNCVLFDLDNGARSCAYIYSTGTVVNYPQVVHSSDNIGRSGACPLYDEAAQRYRLYSADGTYSDVLSLDAISEDATHNMYGWLGDNLCVLEQDSSSRSAFSLRVANTLSGITYTLLTPWDYADMLSSAAAPSPDPNATPVSGIISTWQAGND